MSEEELTLRPIAPADAPACGRIVYDAFRGIAERHGFPPDIASPEMGVGLATAFLGTPGIWGIVAEAGGRIVGSNFLDERDAVRAVGPISIEPAFQGRGVGRRLMEAVLDRARDTGASMVRLVQDAHNATSLSLYASLGFEAREPLALMAGTPADAPVRADGVEVRPLAETDLPACAALCKSVLGHDRANELRDAIKTFAPHLLTRAGKVVAYASAPHFWICNHAVAATDQDMRDLLLGTAALAGQPLAMLVPTRRARLFRWCLAQGFRVVKPMTLMTIGAYDDPHGAFFPSVQY